jgi:protease I
MRDAGIYRMGKLDGRRIAIVATDGFEQSELVEPKTALEAEGAKTDVISLESRNIKGWKKKNWGDDVKVDETIDDAKADDYDALLLPGGVMNPDRLRMEPAVVAFVKAFVDAGKPIAAICHGPQILIETGMLAGRKMTSFKSLKTDMKNAGAMWVDEEVVTDRGLVTSRTPDDIPAFTRKMVEEFAERVHERPRKQAVR